MSEPIQWGGKQAFYIAGTDHEDDTIRIVGGQRETKHPLTLVLPTLCITFAEAVAPVVWTTFYRN